MIICAVEKLRGATKKVFFTAVAHDIGSSKTAFPFIAYDVLAAGPLIAEVAHERC